MFFLLLNLGLAHDHVDLDTELDDKNLNNIAEFGSDYNKENLYQNTEFNDREELRYHTPSSSSSSTIEIDISTAQKYHNKPKMR